MPFENVSMRFSLFSSRRMTRHDRYFCNYSIPCLSQEWYYPWFSSFFLPKFILFTPFSKFVDLIRVMDNGHASTQLLPEHDLFIHFSRMHDSSYCANVNNKSPTVKFKSQLMINCWFRISGSNGFDKCFYHITTFVSNII